MRYAIAVAALIPLVVGMIADVSHATKRCTNGPNTRACWNGLYDIATDADLRWPTTGNTVTYDFVITNTTCDPDGSAGSRTCLLVNGQYPGPTIRAVWGDNIVIHVTNRMQHNGTSIHFHGIRQLNTCGSDGVNGITQCPLAPDESMTYSFQATQYGTSWYHSHFSVQYGDGVLGPIVIDGPATADYDVDLGSYMIGDWYYKTAFQMRDIVFDISQVGGAPPPADTILINGTNHNTHDDGGNYDQVMMTSGRKYRLRLINSGMDNFIRVSLDSHPFQVIAADFVPVHPFMTEWLLFGPGQRYDVVVNANQARGNYWFRAEAAPDCNSSNAFYGRAIWTYQGVNLDTPQSEAFPVSALDCAEPGPLTPVWQQSIPRDGFRTVAVNFTTAQAVPGVGGPANLWSLDPTTSSISIEWGDPSLSYVHSGNTSYPERANVVLAASRGGWNFWLIQQAPGVPDIPHPIHLHGHNFFVLGRGRTAWTDSTTLDWTSPTRRDTTTLPGNGYLAIAFQSNNPGTWLLHCHIAWHISEGFGMQFFESIDDITLPNWQTYYQTCATWSQYDKNTQYKQDDSGL